ncbi:hypothetical protein [Nocardia blacklockiae]|uniref:hypothetical protein n=1 Tax=Nocardia blacklockiae TaxID=480036 RepID=UPI001895890C|nr:hypothetical protein [Nocardia blacklockiae]MBF6174361.1 hypothetical protein [Nocardia blacklockiae]
MLFLRLAVLVVAAVVLGILFTYRASARRPASPRPAAPRTTRPRTVAPGIMPVRSPRRSPVHRPAAHFRSCTTPAPDATVH